VVQYLKVSATVKPKYSFTSQKLASLTWERMSEPRGGRDDQQFAIYRRIIECSAFLETIGSSRHSLSIRLLARRPLVRTDAADMLKRRLKQAGLPAGAIKLTESQTG